MSTEAFNSQPEMSEAPEASAIVQAALIVARLLDSPRSWIHRRVETVDLTSSEETKRRVSIDFSLTPDQGKSLTVAGNTLVPIALLEKRPQRDFDLRDANGGAIPALGSEENAELSHYALLRLAIGVLDESDVFDELEASALEGLYHDLAAVTYLDGEDAQGAVAHITNTGLLGDRVRGILLADQSFMALLSLLAVNYVLFAVLPPNLQGRHIVKFSYGDDSYFQPPPFLPRLFRRPSSVTDRVVNPDRQFFEVPVPGASWANSFHLEIVIPDELRVEYALVVDWDDDSQLSDVQENVNRAHLHVSGVSDHLSETSAAVQLSAERQGQFMQAVRASSAVAVVLTFGAISDPQHGSEDAAVAVLAAGAALYSGWIAIREAHLASVIIYSAVGRWMARVSFVALVAASSLAFAWPDNQRPIWILAAFVAWVAVFRLGWSVLRAPNRLDSSGDE